MSLFFLQNNLHFAVEIFGALAFFMVAWLALDAFFVRKNLTAFLRCAGFLALGIWQIMHASAGIGGDGIYYFTGHFVFISGLFMVLLNMVLEYPPKKPEFKAVIVLPPVAVAAFYAGGVETFLSVLITWFAFQHYRRESNKSLWAFLAGFVFLSSGFLLAVFYKDNFVGALWYFGHIFELLGFASLIWWVWQYLELRVREELLLIFISLSLLISIAVTLAFSFILISQIEQGVKASLLTDAKVMDLAVLRLQEESLAKARLIAADKNIIYAVTKSDFPKLQSIMEGLLESEKLGFLLIADAEGEALLRAHGLAGRGDSVALEYAVSEALRGRNAVTVESSAAEKFSIRAAAPIIAANGKIAGVVAAGFPLDNALADNLKKITGLEMSIFEGNRFVASTIFNSDGRTRVSGAVEISDAALENVLRRKESAVVKTEILSRPFIASFLPIKNAQGEIVGMLSASKAQIEIAELINKINRLTLVTVMILMLILSLPIYIFTKRLANEI